MGNSPGNLHSLSKAVWALRLASEFWFCYFSGSFFVCGVLSLHVYWSVVLGVWALESDQMGSWLHWHLTEGAQGAAMSLVPKQEEEYVPRPGRTPSDKPGKTWWRPYVQ